MKNLLDISKYKFWIIVIYIILFPLFYIFTPDALRYNFATENFGQILLIVLVTFLSFYLLNLYFNFRKIGWQNLPFSKILLVFVYALLFAIPEEIIFRGIIQSGIQNYIDNTFLVIIISSGIFGLAHLPNGANGLHIKSWNWSYATNTLLAGLPLCIIFAITDSLLIPTLLHAFFLIFFKLFTNEAENEKVLLSHSKM